MDNSGYRIIRVARDRDLFEQIGKELYFDLVKHDRVHSFCVPRQTTFLLFKKQVAQEFGIPEQFQRFWKWQMRLNLTYRPYKPLTPEEESKPIGEFKELSHQKRKEVNLFLEVEIGPGFCPVSPPVKTDEDILLFFKLYDPEEEELRYVGRLYAKKYSSFHVILRKVNEMAGFGPDEEIDLYEEIKFKSKVMCELINKDASLQYSQLEDGDIICFQKALVKSATSCGYLTVPSFLEKVRARRRQEVEAPSHPSKRVSLKISNFSKLTSNKCYSEAFTVAGCKWKILIYPRGSHTTHSDYISIYLCVADQASLPIGWTRTVDFGLTVVNQIDRDLSITREGSDKFNALAFEWGFPSFMSLLDLHHPTKGYLVEDALVVEAEIVFALKTVSSVVAPGVGAPSAPLRKQTERFISCLNSLDELIGAAGTAACTEGPSSGTQTSHTVPTSLSMEKLTREMNGKVFNSLPDHFNQDMKKRLVPVILSIQKAGAGIPPEHWKAFQEYRDLLGCFVSENLNYEEDSSAYELLKLQDNLLFSAMNKNRRMHLSNKELSEKLSKEEEELNRKQEEMRSRKSKLISDWDALTAASEETKSEYVSKKRKLAEAEGKKRRAEEWMSRLSNSLASVEALLFP